MKKTMLALALVSVATAAHAENGVLSMAGKPEDVGLSSAQLKRLEEVTQKHVDSGLVPGAVMLVARRGKMKVGTEKVVDGRAVLQLSDPERAMTVLPGRGAVMASINVSHTPAFRHCAKRL